MLIFYVNKSTGLDVSSDEQQTTIKRPDATTLVYSVHHSPTTWKDALEPILQRKVVHFMERALALIGDKSDALPLYPT